MDVIMNSSNNSNRNVQNNILAKWLANVQQARSGGPEAVRFQLNRSAYVIGMQIPRGKVDEQSAITQLIQMGIQSGLDAAQAEYSVKSAILSGKKKELASLDEALKQMSVGQEPPKMLAADPQPETSHRNGISASSEDDLDIGCSDGI